MDCINVPAAGIVAEMLPVNLRRTHKGQSPCSCSWPGWLATSHSQEEYHRHSLCSPVSK